MNINGNKKKNHQYSLLSIENDKYPESEADRQVLAIGTEGHRPRLHVHRRRRHRPVLLQVPQPARGEGGG